MLLQVTGWTSEIRTPTEGEDICLYFTVSGPTLGPTQPPTQ
jgi:hypothetical protein